jgi:hypothetical protein
MDESSRPQDHLDHPVNLEDTQKERGLPPDDSDRYTSKMTSLPDHKNMLNDNKSIATYTSK